MSRIDLKTIELKKMEGPEDFNSVIASESLEGAPEIDRKKVEIIRKLNLNTSVD